MLHNFQVMASTLTSGVIRHLSIWEGWSALIAAALLAWRAVPWWVPLLVTLVINPEPFGLVVNFVHGRHASLYSAMLFTLCQLLLAYAGYLIDRLVKADPVAAYDPRRICRGCGRPACRVLLPF